MEIVVAKKQKKQKLKTYKAAAKRFRVTGSGKIVRTKAHKSHIRRRKSPRSKRLFAHMLEVTTPGEQKRIKRLAPYLKRYRANPSR